MILESITESRILVEAELEPMQGQRFQPTGFADLGAATYTLPNGTRMLLVESAQSMANRLEATIVDADGEVIPELEGISYVTSTLTKPEGDTLVVSTMTEAHRLASPFIISNKDFCNKFCEEAQYGEDARLNWKRINAALFKYDVNSLLHGVFLSLVKGGRIKSPRLLSSFIEASDVREVVSGGVKNTFDPKGSLAHEQCDKDVYANVPFQRTEYTAGSISIYFNLDVAGIRALGLSEDAQNLLSCLALYKVRRILDGGLRLRTACDLKLKGEVKIAGMANLPTQEQLLEELRRSIVACKPLFAEPAVTRLTDKLVKSKKKTANEDDED